MAEQFSLKWNNYQISLTSAFKHILEEEDFVDVTLSAEGQSLKAHKVIFYPTKHLCILVAAPLWYLICTNFLLWCRICTFSGLFGGNLHCIRCTFNTNNFFKWCQNCTLLLIGTNLVSTKA